MPSRITWPIFVLDGEHDGQVSAVDQAVRASSSAARRVSASSSSKRNRSGGSLAGTSGSDTAPNMRRTSCCPSDLTDDQLAAAPVLTSIDMLLIEELSQDEDDAFAAALM
jgi:hypothetical protein